MTKVTPELANAMQELARQMIKPTAEHWKALDSAVSYVLNKQYKGLILKKPEDFKPYIYVNFDYGNDKDQQKSISGRISMLGGMLVGWGAKKQHMVS